MEGIPFPKKAVNGLGYPRALLRLYFNHLVRNEITEDV